MRPATPADLAGLMNAGQFAQAERALRLVLDRGTDLGPLWKMLGVALLRQGKPALDALERAARALPQDGETRFWLGHAYEDQGNLAAAVASYRQALILRPGYVEACNNLGHALLGLARPTEAAVAFRDAIALDPRCAEAHGNLGNALQDLGRHAEAVQSYFKMRELAPDSADVHNNLGNAWLALTQLGEAADSYARALALRPDALGALVNLSDALRGLGRTAEALAVSRRAVERHPTAAEAHRAFGDALFDQGNLDASAAAYQTALQREPASAVLHTALAVTLRQMGRGAAAEASCRRALEFTPQLPTALALLGEIEAGQGDFATAEATFRRALVLEPDLPEGWAGLVRNRKMNAADTSYRDALERLLARPLPLAREITLRFALGKCWDDVGEFDRAFESFARANELTRRYPRRYDRQGHARRIDRIVARHDAAWMSEVTANGHGSERPVFVVGMPRSGTSLAEQILASHPQVHGAGELRFWNAASAAYDAAFARDRGEADSLLGELAGRYLDLLDGLSAAPKIVDKMPANTLHLGVIHGALPHARIVHLRRNPLDTCLSVFFQGFSTTHAYANDLDDLAHYYGEYLRLMSHWRATLPVDSLLEVPYESLVQDPETWSRRMVEFAGLQWDPRCLDFHRTPRAVLTASSWQVRQPISTAAVGRWRNYDEFLGPLRRLGTAAGHGGIDA